MKRIVCACLVFLSSLHAKNQSMHPPPYDADLFKRDIEVFSVHSEFLYWRVQEGALDYALKMRHEAWGPTPSFAQGKLEKATFNGDPGLRIAASYFRASRYWEVWGQYTRLTATGSDSSSKPTPTEQFLTGTWPQITTAPLSGAESHIHLNYNTGELLIDRFFNPNPHLRLRLLGGALIVWMQQDWKIHYLDAVPRITRIRNRWEYVGGGLRIGTALDWFWGHDIYVSGLASTGIVMGSYRNRAEQKTAFQPTASDNTSIPIRDLDFRDARSAFTVQMIFGPSWQKNFAKNRVEVFAGYELNSWFNVQEVYRSTSGDASSAKETWINNGLLTLQGLTARLTVDF